MWFLSKSTASCCVCVLTYTLYAHTPPHKHTVNQHHLPFTRTSSTGIPIDKFHIHTHTFPSPPLANTVNVPSFMQQVGSTLVKAGRSVCSLSAPQITKQETLCLKPTAVWVTVECVCACVEIRVTCLCFTLISLPDESSQTNHGRETHQSREGVCIYFQQQ